MSFDASAVVRTCSSSRRSPDPVSPGLFPERSPPRLLTGAASGGLGSPPARRARRAIPPSLAQHSLCWRPSTSPPLSFLDTRAPDIVARLRDVAGLLIWSFSLFRSCRCVFWRHGSAIIDERFAAAEWGGMMARMLTQVPLPLLPGDAAEIAPGVGMVTGPDGRGVMWVADRE